VFTWNKEEYLKDSKVSFEELAQNLDSIGINSIVRFEHHHDRFIAVDNGWRITLGRGLDLFEKIEKRFSVADLDQTKRKCKSCELTYLRI
jgi:ATP-dependent Lon protease